MSLSLTCKRCDQTISGADEDELVTLMQAHVDDHARTHGHTHTVTGEQVVARLRHQDTAAAPDGFGP